MTDARALAVELIWRDDAAGPDSGAAAFVHSVHRVAAGTTIRQLLERCGEGPRLAAVEARQLGLARFGQRAWLDDQLAQGDRVELLEPIVADARATRFARVAEARRKGQSPRLRAAVGRG